MSRGPGIVERGIIKEIADATRVAHDPQPVQVSSWDVAVTTFKPPSNPSVWNSGWDWQPTNSQRKSIIRAMHSFCRKHNQYALVGGNGRMPLYLFDASDKLSVEWARLRTCDVKTAKAAARRKGRSRPFICVDAARNSLAARDPQFAAERAAKAPRPWPCQA